MIWSREGLEIVISGSLWNCLEQRAAERIRAPLQTAFSWGELCWGKPFGLRVVRHFYSSNAMSRMSAYDLSFGFSGRHNVRQALCLHCFWIPYIRRALGRHTSFLLMFSLVWYHHLLQVASPHQSPSHIVLWYASTLLTRRRSSRCLSPSSTCCPRGCLSL